MEDNNIIGELLILNIVKYCNIFCIYEIYGVTLYSKTGCRIGQESVVSCPPIVFSS